MRIGEVAATARAPLHAWDVLTTDADGHAALDFHPEVRLSMLSNTTLVVGGYVPAEAIVVAGSVHGEMLPSGTAARPSLRIATPSGVVLVDGVGGIVVVVLPSGETWVAALNGQCDVTRGEPEGEPNDRRDARMRLERGHAVLLGRASIAEPTAGPSTMEAAQATAAELARVSEAADARALGPRLDASVRAYDEGLAWLESEIERGTALEAEQRRAANSDPARARELVGELVEFTQRRMRLRALRLVRSEQLDARASNREARRSPASPVGDPPRHARWRRGARVVAGPGSLP